MRKSPLSFFIHPIPVGAVLLMAVNDHVLKHSFPGVFTGKLSDFLGCFYLPLFLAALDVFVRRTFRPEAKLSLGFLLAAILLTDALFILVKVHPAGNEWVVRNFSEFLFPIQIARDPTDLVAFVMNPVTYWWAKRFTEE